MGVVTFKHKGNFELTSNLFKRITEKKELQKVLKKYGEEGVRALASATPKDTGKTAESWYYEIVANKRRTTIIFKNSNIIDYVSIAVILQYGHATKNGGWVEGRDYINPAIQPIFDRIANESWKEVMKK